MDRVILTGLTGSRSYGTETADSDTDYMSIVVPGDECLFGLGEWGKSGSKEESYTDPGLGFVEHKSYEIKKAMRMMVGMNPNIIPLLWLDEKHYLSRTEAGQLLLDNRTLFNSKRAYTTMVGFAKAQLHKMSGIFNDSEQEEQELRKGHLRFQEWANGEVKRQRKLREAKESELYDHGYLQAVLSLNAYSKETVKRIKVGPVTGRMGAARKALRDKHGYDSKFANHTIRLMTMCCEFLAHPEDGLKIYREGIDADLLLAIREGAFKEGEIKQMADDLFVKAQQALSISPLPDEPDMEAIQELTVQIIKLAINISPDM